MNNFYLNKKINPKGLKKDQYDVIIIGAGIGGLVCGCYLARAGLKVLIVEKNQKPGGYCTSFERDGFRFDSGVHGIGGMYEGGNLRRIIDELKLDLEIIRFDPSDMIVFPDGEIFIWNDLNKTIYEFQNKFPKESKSIKSFFNFITGTSPIELFLRLKNKTFKTLLDEYFKNIHLKKILSFLAGNLGVSASIASAFIISTLYREFILNGGYYPKGGMQMFPDSLLKKFKEFGGEVLFFKKVNKINIENNTAKGVHIDKNINFNSKVVISNCDARQTYLELIGKRYLNKNFIYNLNRAVISPSAFVVYLGLKNTFNSSLTERGYGLYFIPTYDIDDIYLHNNDPDDINIKGKDLFCGLGQLNSRSQNNYKKSMHLLMIAPFKGLTFWEKNKYKVAENMIGLLENLIPSLRSNILVKYIATPIDFFNFTLNYRGSNYGWAAIVKNPGLYLDIPIKNFYIVGHWSSNNFSSGGINIVAFLGYRLSKTILKKLIIC